MKRIVDLHIHSALSPCGSLEMSPAAVVARARTLGLDMIAITDHNAVANACVAVDAGLREGVHVVAGMEAQTREGVHVLCYFPTPAVARAFHEEIYPFLPDMKNNEEFFGDQVEVDLDDNVVRFEPRVLLNSLEISIDELVGRVRNHDGEVIPAHVESDGFGLLPHLGVVPPDLDLKILEISWPHTGAQVLEMYPGLAAHSLVSHSDAHYLRDVGRAAMEVEMRELGFPALFTAYRAGACEIVHNRGGRGD